MTDCTTSHSDTDYVTSDLLQLQGWRGASGRRESRARRGRPQEHEGELRGAQGTLAGSLPYTKSVLHVGLTYRVSFFWPPPPNLTMSQAHFKFLYLENLRGGQFKLYRAWDLVKLGGGQKKRHPV